METYNYPDRFQPNDTVPRHPLPSQSRRPVRQRQAPKTAPGRPRASVRWAATTQRLLDPADVRIDGQRPWDIQVHDPRFFRRVLTQGSLGLGESYMDGWWDCERLDVFIERIMRAGLDTQVVPTRDKLRLVWARLTNPGRRALAFHIGRYHYDLGNRLYSGMLDRRMIYSCGYWQTAEDLDQAQEAKLALLCRKLDLRAGMRLLDIGCGWGGTARYMARRCGVSVVGVTVSQEQAAEAQRRCAGLPVEIKLQDYRDVQGRFDRIVSVGMIEHVGVKNYGVFFATARRHLADDGLLVLHTIGSNRSQVDIEPWMGRYIFPNAMLPSARQLCQASEPHFVMEDWHNFGSDYDKTLTAWAANFERRWADLKDDYDERFHRMWRYYLLSCAGCFRARQTQVWQIAYSPLGVPGGYRAVR